MQIDELLSFANRSLAAGQLAACEIACREILERAPCEAAALHLLGVIAARVGEFAQACCFFEQALHSKPDNVQIRNNLLAVRDAKPRELPSCERYLIIREWGSGFWADTTQVLGSLLLAEVTGRKPITWWGNDSRFSDGSNKDAFQFYFQPVSQRSLADVTGPANLSFFPARWNKNNLTRSDHDKWIGKGSRVGAPHFLNRPETVGVIDFFVGVVNVAPWLAATHPMHAKPLDEIYRYLIAKYIFPNPQIVGACERFFESHLADGPYVAVHLRGSDKALEDPDIDTHNRANLEALQEIDPAWPIFLLTDDERWLKKMRDVYGKRIITTDCQRTSTKEGVHYLATTDPVKAGREMLIDTLLALRATKFIGNPWSNVSAMIGVLKNWAPGDLKLIGPSVLAERNLHLYRMWIEANPSIEAT